MISDSLFKEQMRELRSEAYDAIMVSDTSIDYELEDFNLYFDGVADVINKDRQTGFSADMWNLFNQFEREDWRKSMEAWFEKHTQSWVWPKPNEQFKENFQEQLLNAVTQDSANRPQMVLDYFDNNLGPLVDEFGMDGTELIFEILTILSQQEKERLGETSTPEEKLNLDDLDFLDSDDEEFSLIDLEEDADEFEI